MCKLMQTSIVHICNTHTYIVKYEDTQVPNFITTVFTEDTIKTILVCLLLTTV